MRLIAAILVVALSDAAMCGQDFGGHALFVRTADADPGKKNTREKFYEPVLNARSSKEKERIVLVVINNDFDHKRMV